jgi:FHS family Na+ dependent glucose MFS transporter 1
LNVFFLFYPSAQFFSPFMIITATYFFAFIVLGLVTASLGPTLPGLAEQTESQLSQISILFTARSLGYLFGSFLGGRLYDRLKGHPLMGTALFFVALALSFVPLIPHLWALALVLMLVGLGQGLLDVGGNTLIVWLHGKKVGPFLNGLHFFFGIGAFLSPILVAQMLNWSGAIGGAYWLFALLVLPVGVALFRLPSPAAPRPQSLEQTVPRTPYGLVWAIALFMALYVGSEVSFGSWVYTYGVAKGISALNAAYLTSVFWGAFTLSRLVSIPLAARVRPSQLLITSFVGACLSLGVILLQPENLTVLWIGAFGFGFSIAPVFPTLLTFAGNRMAITGRVTGYFFLGANMGGIFLPWFIGQAFEGIGPQFVIYAILTDVLLTITVFAAIFFFEKKRGQGR